MKKPCLRGIGERNDFVLRYKALPYRVAKDLSTHPIASRLSYEDRVQVGYLGLLRACELFDFKKISTRTGLPVKPLSYLYCTVRNWIVSAAYKESTTIRVPHYAWEGASSGFSYRPIGPGPDGWDDSSEPRAGFEEDPLVLSAREEGLRALHEASDLLTIREKYLLKLLGAELPLKEIMIKIHVRSKEMVRVRKKRILWKLRSVLLKGPKPPRVPSGLPDRPG